MRTSSGSDDSSEWELESHSSEEKMSSPSSAGVGIPETDAHTGAGGMSDGDASSSNGVFGADVGRI